jgi:aminoglycoside phosphotransferase (APT) family kinase protein
VSPVQGLDADSVTTWLAGNVGQAEPPFEFSLIAGGRSNLTFAVTDANGLRYVLRRPPLGRVLATAHDMAREHRIVSAVGHTAVPVPPVLGLCTDVAVNGAPFYVMGFVDGAVWDSVDRVAGVAPSVRSSAAEHLVDVVADLHAVDVDEVGLGDLAKRDGYVERQVRRWSSQWEQSRTRDLPAIDEVARRLGDHLPVQRGVSIAHGDFRFGNCLIDPVAGRINAVLDWELCTLGDPLADLGYLGVYWFHGNAATARPNDPTAAGGFPDYGHVVERYALRTGRDVTGIGYYVAFGCWRLAVISEGVYARYSNGAMGDSDGSDATMFKEATESLAERALEAIQQWT